MPAPLLWKIIMKVKKNKESVYLKDFCTNTAKNVSVSCEKLKYNGSVLPVIIFQISAPFTECPHLSEIVYSSF